MVRFGKWILMMPIIAGCLGSPAAEEVGSVDSALVESGDACVAVALVHYLECSELVCSDEAWLPGRAGLPVPGWDDPICEVWDACRSALAKKLPVPGRDDPICEGCREQADSAYEECRQHEAAALAAPPMRATVPQWSLPDYRVEVHAGPTPDECVNCDWLPR